MPDYPLQNTPREGQDQAWIVVTPKRNSTYEYYIRHRLPLKPGHDPVFIDTYASPDTPMPEIVPGARVVINRYVTPAILRLLQQHRSVLGEVIYVLDDDLSAMVWSPAVPLRSKVRPLQTLMLWRRALELVDRIFTASPEIILPKTHVHKREFIDPIMPPAGDKPAPDPTRIVYFAKMHAAEHGFLFPVIRDVLKRNGGLTFDVFASGSWARRWNALPQTTVHGEMGFEAYREFLRGSAPGIFLCPLVDSRLNRARSSAKLLEIAAMGSAPLIADHPVYRRRLGREFDMFVPMERDAWVSQLEKLVRDADKCATDARSLQARMAQDFIERRMF